MSYCDSQLLPQSLAATKHSLSLAWPDPIFVRGRYHFQYKHPAQGTYTESDNAPA